MNSLIRSISPEDAASVQKLSLQLGYSISVEDTLKNINEVLSLKNHLALVAVLDEEIAGWVHAYKTTTIESLPFIELAGLVIDEDQRGKGIGKRLVEEIRKWCIERNVPSLRVRSNVVRKEAHQFYLDLGFAEIKEQKVFQIQL